MTDIYPKFLLDGDCLIIGKVTYHKQLSVNPKKAKGGGLWSFEDEETIILRGESFQFGPPLVSDLKQAVASGKVFRSKFCIGKIEGKKFFFVDATGKKHDLN